MRPSFLLPRQRFMRGAAVCLLVGAATLSHADEDKKSKAQSQRLYRLQQQAQALESQKGALTAEKAQLEGELKSSREALDRARGQARKEAGARRELDALRLEHEALRAQLDTTRAELQEQQQRLQTSLRSGADVQRQAVGLQQGLELKQRDLAACEQKNTALYRLNSDLVARLEKAGSTSIWSGGPFTQISRVQRENDAAALTDRLDAQRVQGGAKP